MKKYGCTVDNMMIIGRYETLKELGKALKIAPQTINSHKRAGRIPDKIALRFARIHNIQVSAEGFFIIEEEQEKRGDDYKSIHYIEENIDMNDILKMLTVIRRKDEEMFDSLYGKIVRKFNELNRESKLIRLENTKEKRPKSS
ncbi:MAG: hypothetical protein Unbinned6242contig1001_25 [Prokaryotic dsDNA virus sp.]|nr:MAG: hypothetical protein Unbinned6242contig1001_25 [Prokaryotic dsDNA virus sp.]|tara:strand:- start:1831 stop:2259 length:429 start_codon:yes stop_codon:yes gene_type:complete